MKILKINQAGRSMVEMLGVLAIIGVLSVAGIAGYSNAMRSYKANEIANAISTLYVTGLSQNSGEGNGELAYTSIGTNPSGATLVYNNKTVTATITDDKICDMVKDKFGSKATGECSGASSTLSIKFEEATATTNEPPADDPSNYDNEGDCENANYTWLYGTENGCFSSPSEAEAYCSQGGGFFYMDGAKPTCA